MASANIGTTSKAYEKALEELKNNPYFDKYAEKIAVLQQISPEEFKSRLETRIEKKKPKADKEIKERGFSVASQRGKPDITNNPFTKPKLLNDVMKVELLQDKTSDEIKQIWLDYHKDKDVIVSVVPKDIYETLHQRGLEFPTFILPVPRSQGYEFIMCQFVAHEVHFTPLIAFQTHKENAPECLTITFYPDLQDSKGIVLMKGEYDPDILNAQEAQCLANELQLFYAQNNEGRLKLLQKFTYSPNEFHHMDLISEVEHLSL